jgi:hypothetical protein
MKAIIVTRQTWAKNAEVYVLEMTYRGVYLIGLTKKASLARKVIEGKGGREAKAAERQLIRDLKQQNGIFRDN